jgi:hypothetical protein
VLQCCSVAVLQCCSVAVLQCFSDSALCPRCEVVFCWINREVVLYFFLKIFIHNI